MLKRSMFLTLLSVIFLSLGPVLGDEQRVDFRELEKVALTEPGETNTPGAAVAIVSGDQIIFAKGFGVSNIETGAPVTSDMLFRIASVTKMFTATALVMLAEQGKLKLDEPIGRYAKGFSPKLAQLTAHQLLTHTAGLTAETDNYGPHDESALASSVRSWKEEHFFTEPGKVYSYSSPGFALAGLIIQEVSGKLYADTMDELLFKPLGMNRTTFRLAMAMTYPLAVGHQARDAGTKPVVVRPFTDNAVAWPAGYMFSSVIDLSRFAIAFMNDGRLEGKQVIPPSVIAQLSTPYADTHGASGDWKQGYGMRVGGYRGVRVIEHKGGTPGFGALLRIVPNHRFAVIILANKSIAQLDKTAEKAMELLLPLEAKVTSKSRPALSMSEAEMVKYAGIYSNGNLRFEILVKKGRLYLRADGEAPLIKIGEYRLSLAGTDAPQELLELFQNLVLLPGADGKAEYLYFGGRALKRAQASK